MGRWWRWTLVSLDGVVLSRMVGVFASVNLPLHHKVQKFSSGPSSPGWSRKRAVKRLWWWWLPWDNFSWPHKDRGPYITCRERHGRQAWETTTSTAWVGACEKVRLYPSCRHLFTPSRGWGGPGECGRQ